jgi:predicted site-specific integrase-resolvase
VDTYLPIIDAANAAHTTPDELFRLIQSGKIKPAMLNTGVLLVNKRDLPTRREDSKEYQAVQHLRGIGIGLRQAEEKYNVPYQTISRWVNRGLVARISGETQRGQRVMVDEADVAYCAELYKRDPGRGKRAFTD